MTVVLPQLTESDGVGYPTPAPAAPLTSRKLVLAHDPEVGDDEAVAVEVADEVAVTEDVAVAVAVWLAVALRVTEGDAVDVAVAVALGV